MACISYIIYLFSRFSFILHQSIVNSFLDLTLKSCTETLEKSRSTRENNILYSLFKNYTIKFSSRIYRRHLDRIIYCFINRSSILGINEFRMEEHFRSQKSFVPNITCIRLYDIDGILYFICDRVLSFIFLEFIRVLKLPWTNLLFLIILQKFIDYITILNNVTEFFL